MRLHDPQAQLALLIADSRRFQPLTDADRALYGAPDLIPLEPSMTDDPWAAEKRRRWIDWRAAPYPASRHSEYLFREATDIDAAGPRILVAAVLDISAGLGDYLAQFDKKGRYRVLGRKASNLGYEARHIRPRDHAAGIYAIIHSSAERQGRPISPMFADRPADYTFPDYDDYADPNYRDICCGVFAPDGMLAAYILGKRVGDHVQYDEIMGHTDHLANDVVYLLHGTFLRKCVEQEKIPTCLNYGPWYSGRNPYSPGSGLNFWKRKTRFRPAYLIAARS